MTGPQASPRRPVVLRYVEDWGELAAQLDADRAAGLAPSDARDALRDWFDDGSFAEVGTLVRRASTSYRGGDVVDDAPNEVPADGLVAGWGRRRGRLVFVAADDPGLGSPWRGAAGASKASRVREHALLQSAPLVQVLAAGRVDPATFLGAEFVRFGYGVDVDFEVDAADHILKVAVVTGPLSGQAALEASWCHLVVLAGPEAAIEGLGGAEALAAGHADLVCADLASALAVVGDALDHLPGSRFDALPRAGGAVAAPGELFLDRGWALELAPGWQPAIRCRFGTVDGHVVGWLDLAADAVLDAAASAKADRLVQFCAAFAVPLLVSHAGWAVPERPGRADVDAYDRLRSALARSAAPVVEIALGELRLAGNLGVRPTWSVVVDDGAGGGTDPHVGDAHVGRAGLRQTVGVALAALEPRRPSPHDDPLVARLGPRSMYATPPD